MYDYVMKCSETVSKFLCDDPKRVFLCDPSSTISMLRYSIREGCLSHAHHLGIDIWNSRRRAHHSCCGEG